MQVWIKCPQFHWIRVWTTHKLMHEHVGKCVVNTVFCPPLIYVSNPEKPKNIMRKCQGKASINKEA